MINEKTFTKEWFLKINNDLKWDKDPSQLVPLEKSILALHLIEELTKAEIDFIFKGGTSLLLLLDKIYRLSIDADIILQSKNIDIEKIFNSIVENSSIFIRLEKVFSRRIDEFAFYRFYYNPIIGLETNIERYIKLDIYLIENPYSHINNIKIQNNLLFNKDTPLYVKIPTVDCILADKLTAFAPETIGVPLKVMEGKRPKRIEFLKQLYDIGNLFDKAEDIKTIRDNYNRIAKIEIKGHKLNIGINEILNDSIKYALIILYRGSLEEDKYKMISKAYYGSRGFSHYVVGIEYEEQNAIIAASKILYLCKLITSKNNNIEKYNKDVDTTSLKITNEKYLKLNEYNYAIQEAFFYIYLASKIA